LFVNKPKGIGVPRTLSGCNTRDAINPNMSYNDMSKLFSTIDSKCDAIINSEGIEENMDNINKYLRRFATMIVQNYMHIG
jgi:hypothetical protein